MSIRRETNRTSETQKTICLPVVKPRHNTYYRTVTTSRAKVQKQAYWYTDNYVDFPDKIEELVAMMDERERFKGLREFVRKLIRMHESEAASCDVPGIDEFRMRFLINAHTSNDAILAMLYMNYHLQCNSSAMLGFDRVYRLHDDWRSKPGSSRVEKVEKNEEVGSDGNVAAAKPLKKEEDKREGQNEDDEPVWCCGYSPMYLESTTHDYKKLLADSSLLDKFQLIYALEYRSSISSGDDMIIEAMDDIFGPGPSMDMAIPDARHSQLRAGFKTIYIPDSGDDELRVLFSKIVSGMKMSLAKELSFDSLRSEYSKHLATEHDVLATARLIKENKALAGELKKPISYRDFVAVFDAEAEARKLSSPSARKGASDNPWDELNKLVSVEQIKTEARKMIDCMLLDKRRRELGLPGSQLTKHCVFFGSPGTSKTTVARILAKIMQYEGIIRGNAFRDLNKSDVVGAYVGWTAKQVDGIFNEISNAGGGVLLFDEAYTYTMKDSTCYDKEAINCIVQNMENHREIMCIFAGYKDQMQSFVEANPGLRSRIGFVYEFSDYNPPSMCQIVEYQANLFGYKLPAGCMSMLEDYFAELKRLQGDGWGNGREARKLIENATLELASRLAKQKRRPNKTQVTVLDIQDIKNAIDNSLERERAFESKTTRKIGYM